MMLQEQNVPINFGNGTDTKTDPKAVVPGKFIRAENGVFTNPERFLKRNGYTTIGTSIVGGGNLVAPTMIHGYKDEILCADSNSLYSYSSTQSAWANKGSYISTDLSRKSIDQSTINSGYSDSVIAGNIGVYVWTSVGGHNASLNVGSVVYLLVKDLATGAILYGPTAQTNSALISIYFPVPVRAVLLGGTVPAIIYPNEARNGLVMRTITIPGSGGVTVSAGTTVTTNYQEKGPTPISGFSWDIAQTSTGAVLVYGSVNFVPQITISKINTAGSVTASTQFTDAGAKVPIHVVVNSTSGDFWIYFCHISGGSTDVVYTIYDSSLVQVLATTVVEANVADDIVTNIIAVNNSATQQTVYYGIYNDTTAGGPTTDVTIYNTVTSAGVVGTPRTFVNGLAPFSNPIIINSIHYAIFVYRGAALSSTAGFFLDPTPQPTFFLLKINPVQAVTSPLTQPQVAARFANGLANSSAVLGVLIRFTPNIIATSSTNVEFTCGLANSTITSGFYATANILPQGVSGVYSYSMDFNGVDSFIPTNVCDVCVLNGGLTTLYDGETASEFGFHVYPEISSVNDNSSGSGIAAGTYQYIAIFQWTDNLGNLHQSTPSATATITLGSATTVTVNLSLAYLSTKPGVSVALFRTKNGENVFYRVDNPTIVTTANPGIGVFITITDGLTDAEISGNLQAYTYPSSSVLENSTPPPSMILLAHNNRLWMVDAENPNVEWYTKSYNPGDGLSPSGLMTQTLDPKFGDITALAEMDEKLVSMKEAGIFVQSGDGINDVGSDSSLSFPQFVPSDVGCSELKSVVTTPTGVMFKSLNGIYILSRSLNVAYLGAEVEQYNSQTITSADLIVGKSQIRFLCSTGLTLVYDYIFNKWATFTNHTGISASDWNGTYVYLRTNGVIYKETPGTYTDNATAYSVLLQTSWLAFAGIQGFQRVRRLIILGDYINGLSASHGISVSAAYDFSTTFQNAVSYLFGAASSSGVLQYRERLPIQKCDSVSLLIQELTTGSSLEYLDLTNMSFEVGVKKGVNKLGGTKSVG